MLSLALMLAAVLPAGAADLSGQWPGTLHVNGRDVSLYMEFRDGLAGSFGTRPDFLMPLDNVRLTGGKLTFDLHLPGSPEAKFEGVVEGDTISGQLTSTAQVLTGRLELKRAGPLPRLPASFAPAPAKDDLAGFSDEFDDPESLKGWKNLSDAEGWPNRIEQMDVNKTSGGHLHLVPLSAAWWAGYHGVYLYKEVKGDFVVTTRLKVTGKSGGEPENIWTISGLLVRAPADVKTARDQRKENWIYVMSGRGPASARVVDAKSTVNGANLWDITPAEPGWWELRIARLGPLFVLLSRPDGGEWAVRKRIVRADLPETLQVGINATSDFKLSASMSSAKYNAELFPGQSKPDARTLYDYVRFRRVPGEAKSRLAGKELPGVSDAELLELFR